MADTKTRAKRDDDDTTTTAGEQQGPKPAETYAGSGTTEPVKLNPETHGAYSRTTGTI